jgi:pimeloyl-ACP methyl ester carboxylesterase
METGTVNIKTIVVADGKLAYEVNGEGQAVLCLPSLGDTRREYERFAPVLAKAGYRVISTDLRGMGGSEGRFKSFNIPELCEDITAILNAENISEVVLVACSVSGASAGLYAANHPERVKGLIMFNPLMHTGNLFVTFLMVSALRLPVLGRKIWLSYFKTLYPGRPVEPEYLAQLKELTGKPGAMASIAGMCMARRIDDDTSRIKVPALIYFGSKDPDFKDVQAEANLVQQKIPSARIKVLEGLGHYPQREQPEAVLPEVLDWLASLNKARLPEV